MSQQFHINKHGVPAPCRARKGNCPFGGSESHYSSKEEAQRAADKQNEKKFGILPRNNEIKEKPKILTHKIAKTPEQFEYIERRKNEIKNQKYDKQKYIERCKSTKKLDNYTPSTEETHHYRKERTEREEQLIKEFGEGEIIGHYKVNHLVGKDNPTYKEQIVEVRDTGQIKVYDVNTGRTVTTFMAHRQRIEVMMLQSGEMPQEKWMRKVNENRRIAAKKKLNVG